MEQRIIKRLENIVGSTNIIFKPEERICYSYDGTIQRGTPDVVVFPDGTGEVSEIIKLANLEKIPVFPRGAGTGLSGGSIPQHGGIALVLTRMNRIKEISKEDLLAVVEPGVITGNLHQEVERLGLFYPPDPASLKTCTMGGNIAENAGGPRAFKYGVTRDYVLGLEVVTPTGDIMQTGGRTVKNVTGYDLTRLLTGSEGTLGVVTQIIVRLIPKPKDKKTALVIFDDLDKAASTVNAIISEGVIPATLEIMDRITIECVEKTAHLGLPIDAEAVLLIEVDGSLAKVSEDIQIIEDICTKNSCRAMEVASLLADRERLWKARRAVSSAIVQLKPTKISEDATVPRSKIPEMIRRLREISEKYNLFLPVFGHAGDGNLHPNIIADKNDKDEMERAEKAVGEIFKAALDLGGTLSGEHGIGVMKKNYLEGEMGAIGLNYLRAIKKAVDPQNILNPGKIF
ncbi:FAD-binding oxidoreductase [Candidatus Formimonas warabiya]|uniref:Glycolate oxidase subunit GlcD n=1 Tax=Formimonas warabiya TaxID=1761012 RepID=A0A3G1KLY5_FORW1|nr:FAD-linked oxidase C-terminal domain-containing protein [Candidatus Formimonas warabiya]ATW23486.1 glycolate oxidase subunit GlcD [Candidatus Formimonas warabiya]